MITLVIGGSCSGKSEYAEQCLDHVPGEKIYLATMIAADEESLARVRRHREKRSGRGFRTIECPRMSDLAAGDFPPGCNVLLEGIGTLAANELFGADFSLTDNGTNPCTDDICALLSERITADIDSLRSQCSHLTIVTNEVFSGGKEYEGETLTYLRLLAALNRKLAARADLVVEVVCGLPDVLKGPKTL